MRYETIPVNGGFRMCIVTSDGSLKLPFGEVYENRATAMFNADRIAKHEREYQRTLKQFNDGVYTTTQEQEL